MEKITARIS